MIGMLLFTGKGMAQNATTVQRKGDWLAQMEKNAPKLYEKYQKDRKWANTGGGLLGAGVGLIVLGAVIGNNSNVTTSVGAAGMETGGTGGDTWITAGVTCIIVGTPVLIVGLSKTGRTKRAYQRDYGNISPESPSSLQTPHLKLHPNGLAFVF